MKEKALSAVVVTPLFKDIRYAAARLGTTVFNVRTLVWNHLLKPIRQGQKFLFTEEMLIELAAELASGKVEFPKVPAKKPKKATA
jgi:hypothetical protein